jgi:hypothetical protein
MITEELKDQMLDIAEDVALYGETRELDDQQAKQTLAKKLHQARDATLASTLRLPADLHNKVLAEASSDEWLRLARFLFDALSDFAAASPGNEREFWDRYDQLATKVEEWFEQPSNLTFLNKEYLSKLHDLFAAPVVKYGKNYLVVDRGEIEGIRAIHKLIKAYLDRIEDDPGEKHHPLSVAVFGPPGSGKSMAVKSIVESLKTHQVQTEVLLPPFNLAELTDSDDLERAFGTVVNATAENKVALAFFDEFDAHYKNEQWGWLKFFLSPMEDMEFRGKKVHNSIFVFAGGTSSTYEQFALLDRPTTDPQVQKFGMAKGPDFKSRLAGYLNIVGVNPADSDDGLYLIRRAIVIRSILTNIQHLKLNEKARIDPDMLRAILFVPSYANGARSLRKLLEWCSQDSRRWVKKSSVPLIHQLNMLTDGKAFMDLLADVSSEEHTDKASNESP